MGITVWKNDAARKRLEGWDATFASKIEGDVERRKITTSQGPGRVLLVGSPSHPVIVCLHAMRTGAAHLLSELGPLSRTFRLIAPDLPGQSVYGPQVRLPLKDDSAAKWLIEVLDQLQLHNVNLFGVSWGGFVARQAASTFPDRVQRFALLVPAGIANGSHWKGLMKMAIPMLRYKLNGSERNLRRFLDPLLSTWDDDWANFMGESLHDMPMDLRIPPLATDDELRRLTMPTLVLGAEKDISFPGEAVISRMKTIVNGLDTEVISECKHCLPTTPQFRDWLGNRLSTFFRAR